MKGITGNPAIDAYHRMGVTPVGGARPVERPEASSASPSGSAAAQVSISARARDMATDAAGQGVDASKVEAMRQRIADGSFQADSRKIAARMIEQLG